MKEETKTAREIKFRLWFKEWEDNKGKMFYNALPITTDFKMWMISFDNDNVYDSEFEVGKDIELMQFTGLHDKNGKEVYEGDILRIYFDLDEIEDWLFNQLTQEQKVNCWIDKEIIIPDFYQEPISKNCEVIGNIWEGDIE